MAGKYRLTTLGCKVNQYESQQIRELLESLGLRAARDGETPDIAIVNTCAVTAEAARKTRQAVRRTARDGPTRVVAVGCAASENPQRLRDIKGVCATVGHDADIAHELRKLVSALPPHQAAEPACGASGAGPGCPDVDRNDVWIMPFDQRTNGRTPPQLAGSHNIVPKHLPDVKAGKIPAASIRAFAGHQRAPLKVQDGCDARCTYCIIPRLRPNLSWKPIEATVAEARDLVRSGHKEIVVTGVFLGAYGHDTARRTGRGRGESSLPGLIDALAQVEGLCRIRLSSLEPGDVTEDLLALLAGHDSCVPHLHLPLQSGSDRVLRRMNRQYRRDAYIGVIDRVRRRLDRPAITTDVMVGFPGETEEDFEATLEVARHAMFSKIHAFPFSPRPGTAAATWTDDFVNPDEVRERMRRLGDLEWECSVEFRRSLLGCVERVIVEKDRTSNGHGDRRCQTRHGRADRYFEVHFESEDASPGDLVSVRIDRVAPARTHGTCLTPGSCSSPCG